MSAALSPPSRAEDSLVATASARSLTVVSAADIQQGTQADATIAERHADAMDAPDASVGSHSDDVEPAVAPGPISEEGSSAQGDSADVVMEGTAEPEESTHQEGSAEELTSATGEQGNNGTDGTGAGTLPEGNAAAQAGPDGGVDPANRPNDAGDEESEDDDEAASQASSDYEHRFFLENFEEDVSTPGEEELPEMERRKADEFSALDQDYWVKHSFTHLSSNSDPEYEILPEVHQLQWNMEPYHGTKAAPNREPFTRSPPMKIVNHDGKEFSFCLKVFPHGNDGTDMVSVYVECFPEGGSPQDPSGRDNDGGKADDWWEVTAQIGCIMYNPGCPTVQASQKAAHQFTSINSDFGWTRFTGPWAELHKRKHLQPVPLLQRDKVAFVVYIRLIKDSTRALWWHNLHDHRNDWDPVLKTGYRGYHIDSQPSGYPAIISALAVWLEIPAFRKLVEAVQIPDAYQKPLETHHTLLMALKKALHDKLTPKSAESGACSKITYLDGVNNALVKHGHSNLQNPFDVWQSLEAVLIAEAKEAAARGELSLDSFEEFFRSIEIIKYSIEPAFPVCPDLEDTSEPSVSSQESLNSDAAAPAGSVRAVLSLAKQKPSAPEILHVELPRQTYETERRRWRKVTTRIEIDETVEYHGAEYRLFGLISHSGELGNLRYNPILRPRGHGTQWLRWSTRCNHTTRGYVVPQTYRQAVDSHQGSGTSSTIAYAVIYVKEDVLQKMVQSMPERSLHDVYNPLTPLASQTIEEPEQIQVAIHDTGTFTDHRQLIGFIDPWSSPQEKLTLQLPKDGTIFDLRAKIRALDAYKDKQFGLYRLLLINANHRYDPQVREERFENPILIPSVSNTYGTHFLMHTLSGDQAEAAEKQHEELERELSEDSTRDIDANAESIVAEREAQHLASLPPPPEPSAPVPETEQGTDQTAQPDGTQETTDTDAGQAPGTDGDVVMSGTDEAAQSPTAPVTQPAEPSSEGQPGNAQTDPVEQERGSDRTEQETNADVMEQETKADEAEHEPAKTAEEPSDVMQADPPKRSQQLLDATRSEEKGLPVQFISCMSEEGRNIVSKKLNRVLMHEESTSHFVVRYAKEHRLHFFSLVLSDPSVPGARVDKFTLQKVEITSFTETYQSPRNHALVFVKHYYPSKGPALEPASAVLVPRDSTLKDALKRPNSTKKEMNCYLEQPGDSPNKLREESTLIDSGIMTGCVLITDPVMPDMMATTLTKRGLPSSVTDFLKPKTGFTTGFGKGWADCETLHGRAHGHGRIIYPNGDAYDGQLVSGRRQGKGTMFFADGNSYRGDWKTDEPDGQGTIVYASTMNKYEGPFKDGRPFGSGGVTYWKKAEAGSRICRVCLYSEMNSALIPCGHMVVCTECGSHLSECPVCRVGVDRVQRIWDCSQT